jgi:hypothetical protein
MSLIDRFVIFRNRHPHLMISLFVVVWFGSLGIAGEMDREDQQLIAEQQ